MVNHMQTTNKKTTKIFISYKTGDKTGLTYNANSLRRELERIGYNVWMDEVGLDAGINWNEQLYKHVSESDLVLVLLAKETAESVWVRREVDVARGAKVRIIPVLIRNNFDTPEEKQKLLDQFDFSKTQYVELLSGSEHEFKKLIEQIEKQEGKTLKDQMDWLTDRQSKYKGTPVKPQRKYYASFKLDWNKTDDDDAPSEDPRPKRQDSKEDLKPCWINLAVGDMTKMSNIDVLVNSENAYLQMARIFESKTVSALLRYYGSEIDSSGHLAKDYVQDELNEIVKERKWVRPVGIGTVIETSAGAENSILRAKNKARYIFHTVTVSITGDGIERNLLAAQSDTSIWQATYNTLKKVDEVNEEIKKRNEVDKNLDEKEIRSIILPLYASGHGGRNAGDVMVPLIEGVKDFLIDAYKREAQDEQDSGKQEKYKLALKDIFLCVLHREYVALMREKMGAVFKEVKAPIQVIE